MTHEYDKPYIGIALGDQKLFAGADSDWDDLWTPSEPGATATLWRYMSFAKFSSLLDQKALFFSLVGDMEDNYEGFVFPPMPREQEDRLLEAELLSYRLLREKARACLVSCWMETDYESGLMWKAYAGTEGIAIRTTFQDLRESIRSIAELPVTFGQVEYVDFSQTEARRLGWAPLFRKRMEYRDEGEVRAVLPGPPFLPDGFHKVSEVPTVRLDLDVAEQRGRYVPVNIDILVKEVVLPPHASPWFAEVVNSVVRRSPIRPQVTRSSIESAPHEFDRRNIG